MQPRVAELCKCHGEPAYWHTDRRKPAGGYWICAVKGRERSRQTYGKRRAVKLARQRARYDNDPIHRIEKRLHDDARKRRGTIERRRAALANDHGGF